MGMKAQIKRRIARHVLSLSRRDAMRARYEKRRIQHGMPHQVAYFHDVADPYSNLMAQMLPILVTRYDFKLDVYLVPPPPNWAAPDRPRLEKFARQDAQHLAERAGLKFKDPERQLEETEIKAAQLMMLAAIEGQNFLDRAASIGEALWAGDIKAEPVGDQNRLVTALQEAAKKREKLGHYLAGMLYYGGEWYWGPDRLYYLEQRLQDLGAGNKHTTDGLLYPPQDLQLIPLEKIRQKELNWYFSFRSPYSAIAIDRVKELTRHYGSDLKLRFVLPMVMRGMPVHRSKRMYIAKDAAREANRLGVPFGDIVDPLGSAVERGYGVLQYAIEQGSGFEFTNSFFKGVWSEGIDAATDKGLRLIAERAGLNWQSAKEKMQNPHWRKVAEQNRSEMTEYGVWGVPSFRVGSTVTWGQDRLWRVEEALRL